MKKNDTENELSNGVLLYGNEALRKLNWTAQLARQEGFGYIAADIDAAAREVARQLEKYSDTRQKSA